MVGRRWSACVGLWLLLVGSVSPLARQIGAGTLTGGVSDQAGAAVPGATVTATAVATNLSRTSVTGSDGRYAIPRLASGSYRVRVESSGFSTLTRDGVQLATGETVRLDLQLAVGAVRLSGAASTSLGLPGIPSNARFPDTVPTFLIAGYQQLGSPPNTATDFGTSVTEIADSLTWLKGRHTFKIGADLRWERLNVVQPPSPTGSFTFSSTFTDLPGVANTGTPLASFLLGQVQLFTIDLQRGPGYRNVDLALMRRVQLPANNALEVRAEVFNQTNTPPLGAPNGVFGSAAFGSITSAGDPRVIQLALKFVL